MLDTKNKSISQLNGSAWGMRVVNSASVQKYEVFEGSSYASGTIAGVYPLTEGVRFSNPSSSSTLDIAFSKVTGALSGNQIVSIVDGGADNLVGDVILSSLGGITQRFETGVSGYWHLDESTSSVVYDASGSGNTGTLVNASWASGSNCRAGSCLSFSGSNSYMNASSSESLSPQSAITISLWIKLNAIPSGTYNEIVQKYGAYGLKIDAVTSKVIGYVWGAPENHYSTTALTTGTWYHIAMTFDGSVHKIYVNGVNENSENDARSIPVSSNPLRVAGRESAGAGEYINGILDEIRIYNRALSASEIKARYNDLKP